MVVISTTRLKRLTAIPISKEIIKRHKKNPKDKSLHTVIETGEIKKNTFNKLIQQSTKQEPFDKKK